MKHEADYKGHTIRVSSQQVTPSSTSPHIVQVALWIDGKRVEPMVGSDFPPCSFVGREEEEGLEYARQAAERIIDKKEQ